MGKTDWFGSVELSYSTYVTCINCSYSIMVRFYRWHAAAAV